MKTDVKFRSYISDDKKKEDEYNLIHRIKKLKIFSSEKIGNSKKRLIFRSLIRDKTTPLKDYSQRS